MRFNVSLCFVCVRASVQYASQSDSHHFAAETEEQRVELQYAVRLLASHPSLALWSGCNECGGSAPFATFVSPTIAGM